MSYIFISHAAPDKRTRVKPIVEMLVELGEPVWIDRPGIENDGFGFSPEYIAQNDIDYVGSGNDWSVDLQTALRNSGAVLGCLSHSLQDDRKVLIGEFTVARAMGKLVTCIVDDMSHSELSTLNMGMLMLGTTHSPHINCSNLNCGLELIHQGQASNELPIAEKTAVHTIENLVSQINRVRIEPRRLRLIDIKKAISELNFVNDGPPVQTHEIPEELIHALADHSADRRKASSLIMQGNKIIEAYLLSEGISERRKSYTLRLGELPPAGVSDGDTYWQVVLSRAGARSRKSLYSFLSTPVANWAFQQAGVEASFDNFVLFLKEH